LRRPINEELNRQNHELRRQLVAEPPRDWLTAEETCRPGRSLCCHHSKLVSLRAHRNIRQVLEDQPRSLEAISHRSFRRGPIACAPSRLILQAQPFDCQAFGRERQTEGDFHNGHICSTRDQPREVVYLNVDTIFSMERHGNYTHLKPENRPNDSVNVMETPDCQSAPKIDP
jgi:hypothetical protein